VTVDEYDKARGPQATPGLGHPGRAPSLTRSAVVTVAIFAPWARCESERAFYRYATPQLRAAFAGLPARRQCTRLVRQPQDLLVAVGHWLTGQVGDGGCAYAVLDSTAVVTRTAQRRGTGWLAGQAELGGSTRVGWYEGLQLLTAVPPAGVSTGYGCAPAAPAEQRVAETLLAARTVAQPRVPAVGRPVGGGSYLAATNVAGTRWGPHWRHDDGAVVRCPPKRQPPLPFPWPRALRRRCAGLREIVATVHGNLLLTFALAHQRPPTVAGIRARLAATVALHNFCCWLNQRLGRPLLAFADLLDW